jgi:hypothetical protein
MFRQRHTSLTLALSIAGSLFGADACLAGDDGVWPAGSTQSLFSDLHLTSTLVVEEGVTVMVNSGVAIIIEAGGNLIVNGTEADPVLFTNNSPDRWNGIQFASGSLGQIEHAIVEFTNDVGILVEDASPSIDASTVRDVRGAALGSAARGIHVTGPDANPSITRCFVENIRGRNGVAGSDTADAANGADGADGTFLFPNPENGGNGSPGGIGGTGGGGGWAYGIVVEDEARATLKSNHIRSVLAGNGGVGGSGGDGGDGGDGGMGANGIFVGNAGIGGDAGNGGPGGTGGTGGWAIGIRLWDLPSNLTVAQNLVELLDPGNGGTGGLGGWGGNGGYGSGGWDFFLDAADTDGGAGGDAGDGGNGGVGGNGGTARAFDVQNGSADVSFVQNTIATLLIAPGGNGGFPGGAGLIGLGGEGGSAANDGADGAVGSAGSTGAVGQAGTRHGAFTNIDLVLTNNVISFGGSANGTALVASGSGSITAGFNCVFGFTSLSEGSVTVQAGNVLLDPLFVNAAAFDFRLSSQSPAIDAGSNAAVPVDLLEDLDGSDRSVDGDENGSTIVDMGAYEFQTQPPCLADLSGDGNVGPADLAQLLASWGACKGCPADLNNDDSVGPADLAQLLASWGICG